MISSAFAGAIADKMGRRKTLMVTDLLFISGGIMLWVLSDYLFFLLLGRFIVGLGMGSQIMINSIYLSESSPLEVRGAIVASGIAGIFLGIILSYIVGIILPGRWQTMMGLAVVPATI